MHRALLPRRAWSAAMTRSLFHGGRGVFGGFAGDGRFFPRGVGGDALGKGRQCGSSPAAVTAAVQLPKETITSLHQRPGLHEPRHQRLIPQRPGQDGLDDPLLVPRHDPLELGGLHARRQDRLGPGTESAAVPQTLNFRSAVSTWSVVRDGRAWTGAAPSPECEPVTSAPR